MHAAIDVIIRRNHFHHCTRGLWLDWQAQGTRVTQNLFHDNTLPNEENANLEGMDGIGEDIFIEISHGPTLVDNNVLLSDRAMKLATQGVAVVHNLIAGSFTAVGRGVNNGSEKLPSPRYTPYHVPHLSLIHIFNRKRAGMRRRRGTDCFCKRRTGKRRSSDYRGSCPASGDVYKRQFLRNPTAIFRFSRFSCSSCSPTTCAPACCGRSATASCRLCS